MKLNKWKRSLVCSATMILLSATLTVCSTGKQVEYSSIADHEQKISHARTEMLIIKGDDEKISRDFSVLSAVDYLRDGKKIYYLMIVPASSSNPDMSSLEFRYDYPYIINGQSIDELLVDIDKIVSEWDSTDRKYSGAVYNFYISSPQDSRPWFEEKTGWWKEKKIYEAVPYIKFNYSKNERKAKAKLAVGTRIDQVIYTNVDGKTIKSSLFFQEDEKSWSFDNSAEMKDFLNLLAKGLRDLRDKGMDGYSRKTEIKAEIKKEVPEIKTEIKPAEKKTQKKKRRKL